MAPSIVERFKRATDRPQSEIVPDDLEWFGVRNLTRTAKAYNVARNAPGFVARRRLHHDRDRFGELLRASGAPAREPVVMRDGWAIDDSLSNPHIPAVLEAAEAIIGERGLTTRGGRDRAFIRDILAHEDLSRFPAFLDFATSPDVVATVCDYLDHVPILSSTVPPGIRLTESSADGQEAGDYRTSQLYHSDLHDLRLVYVVLLLRDTTPDSGPFTFLSASDSERVTAELAYLRRGRRYRLTDEEVYGVVGRDAAMPFLGPKGTILFIDSARCLHFGSRDAVTPRYQLMCAYVSVARSDFTEDRQTPRIYPLRPEDPPLRRLLLDKGHRPS